MKSATYIPHRLLVALDTESVRNLDSRAVAETSSAVAETRGAVTGKRGTPPGVRLGETGKERLVRHKELADALQGLRWWNALTRTARTFRLEQARSARPADAYAARKRSVAVGRNQYLADARHNAGVERLLDDDHHAERPP
jgi:hypothetical protein